MGALLFIAFLLASFGSVNIITGSKLFAYPRKILRAIPGKTGEWLGYWIQCPMCVGVPMGMFWFLIGLYPDMGLKFWPELLSAGAISSGFCWIMRVVLAKLGEDSL